MDWLYSFGWVSYKLDLIIRMNIINRQKFKPRQRTITQPVSSHDQYQFKQKQSNPRYSNQHTLTKQTTITQTTSYKPEQQNKPSRSQIINIQQGSSMLRSSANKNQQAKKRPYRYLQIDTSKEPSKGQNILATKSLSKDRNSSTDSLRIHKIKSIVNLQRRQLNNQKKESFHIPKPNRYDDSQQNSRVLDRKSKQQLIKSILEQRNNVQLRRKINIRTANSSKNSRDMIKQQFFNLNERIRTIDKQVQLSSRQQIAKRYYYALSDKNKRCSINIIYKFLKRNLSQIQQRFFENLLS